MACLATAANVNDTVAFERLFLAAFAVLARIQAVFDDKGYDAEANSALSRAFRAEPHIRKRGRPHRSGRSRGPVERCNAWLLENKRPALRYDRLGFMVQSLLQSVCLFQIFASVDAPSWQGTQAASSKHTIIRHTVKSDASLFFRPFLPGRSGCEVRKLRPTPR